MSKIRCPKCGYTESDDRPHDRETYEELCVTCAAIRRSEIQIADVPDPERAA